MNVYVLIKRNQIKLTELQMNLLQMDDEEC
jgi:hypothetical protein